METMQELIPFAKEMLRQRPSRGLLRVYLLGSVLAVLGTAIGLVETVCHPFSSGEPVDAEMLLMMARQHRVTEAEIKPDLGGQEEEEEEEQREENMTKIHNLTPAKTQKPIQRSTANRLHAS